MHNQIKPNILLITFEKMAFIGNFNFTSKILLKKSYKGIVFVRVFKLFLAILDPVLGFSDLKNHSFLYQTNYDIGTRVLGG